MTEAKIRQAIDAGKPIWRLIKYSPDTKTAIDFFIGHLQERFPRIDHPNGRLVCIQWKILYFEEKVSPLFIIGLAYLNIATHGKFLNKHKELTFATFHDLTSKELFRLRHNASLAVILRFFIQSLFVISGGLTLATGLFLCYSKQGGVYAGYEPYFFTYATIAILSFFAYLWTFAFPLPYNLRFLAANQLTLEKIIEC